MQTKQEPRISAGTPYFLIGSYDIPPCDGVHIYSNAQHLQLAYLSVLFLSVGTKEAE